MKLWNRRDGRWYTRKEMKALYPNKKHPDYLRDRLNEKGMKKLKRDDLKEYLNTTLFERAYLCLRHALRKKNIREIGE